VATINSKIAAVPNISAIHKAATLILFNTLKTRIRLKIAIKRVAKKHSVCLKPWYIISGKRQKKLDNIRKNAIEHGINLFGNAEFIWLNIQKITLHHGKFIFNYNYA